MTYEKELTAAMCDYNKAHREKVEAEARKDEAKTKILILLKTNNIDRFNDGVFSTKLTVVKRKVLDQNALDEYLLESSNNKVSIETFKEETVNERLTVKSTEEDEK